MRVFIDTSAVLALVNPKETEHRAAVNWRAGHTRARFVTSTDVFDEAITRMRYQAGHSNAVALGRALAEGSGGVEMVEVTATDRERAWALFEQREAIRLSHTDCTIAAVMERLGVTRIFTFDEDFEKLGFEVVP